MTGVQTNGEYKKTGRKKNTVARNNLIPPTVERRRGRLVGRKTEEIHCYQMRSEGENKEFVGGGGKCSGPEAGGPAREKKGGSKESIQNFTYKERGGRARRKRIKRKKPSRKHKEFRRVGAKS